MRFGLTPLRIITLLVIVLAGEVLLLHVRAVTVGAAALCCPHNSKTAALLPGLQIGAAVLMAFYQCSGYFQTGAVGTGLRELLQSYRGLGFHPNWRSVLFSTIMLVILITWPRKFKKLSKVLPAGLVGLVLVTALNYLLNPDAARSLVPEFSSLLPSLPLIGRIPISPLSMLLIFAAWEEIPWGTVKQICTKRRWHELLLLLEIPVVMCLV